MSRLPAVSLAFLLAATGIAAAQSADDLVGKWGLASYWKPEDAAKARGWAKSACGSPYTIAKSPGGNLMLHIADDPEPKEIRLTGKKLLPVAKVEGGNRKHERTITAFDTTSFELTWTNPGVGARYGINVYVRCGR